MKYIIYVEDEAELGELFEDLFFPIEGFEYKHIDNPLNVKEFTENNEIAGIFCDHQMPKLSGMELSKTLDPSIPFILISGNIDLDITDYPNIDRLYIKPIEDDQFEEAIELIKSRA